jgi:regulator of cell morphogenesis and NO signaling
MKLADLVDENFSLVGVLSRVGIGFGFGDDTVEEACRRCGVNTGTFLLICDIYIHDNFIPSSDLLRETELRDIVSYLHKSHAYYLDIVMASLADSIAEMVRPCGEKYRKIIGKFFNEYKEELERHFEYEEKTVFPYVNAVLNHEKNAGYSILQYEEHHTDVEEKLADLKNIVMKYLPGECDTLLVTNVLSNLYYLGRDLEKHTLIEDDILVPVVNAMEKNEG